MKVQNSLIKRFLCRRTLVWCFVAIISASGLTQLYPDTASAVSKLQRAAQSATLYAAVSTCLDLAGQVPGLGGGNISEENAISGVWFNGNHYGAANFLTKGSDEKGMKLCNTLVQEAVKFWEYGDAKAILCEAGVQRGRYSFKKGGSCENSTDGNFNLRLAGADHVPKIINTLGKKAAKDQEGIDKNARNYLLYRSVFMGGCQAKVADTGVGDRDYRDVPIVDGKGDVKRERFEALPTDTKRFATVINTGTSPAGAYSAIEDLSCKDAADGMKSTADAYAKWAKAHPEDGDAADDGTIVGDDEEEPEENTCGIQSGYFICPILEFTAGIADGIYDNIVGLFVAVPPISTDTGPDNATFAAWKNMRNIANIAFILAFMIIIYSQVTSYGVSNYGVKKLLPRLIIAAILVNISYWVSAIAVDLSNIAGVGIKDLLDNFGSFMQVQDVPLWADIVAFLLSLGAVAVAGAGVTIGAAVLDPDLVLGILGFVIPLLLAAVLAVMIAVVILVLRQAAIIICVIVSPLAFVAMLLPNTERWFTKWRQWFLSFLLLYPAVSLLFGGAKIGAVVIANANTPGPLSALVMYASAQFVMVAPLFAIPFMIRSYAGNGIDKLGAKIKSRADGFSKRISDPMRRFSKDSFKQSGNKLRRKAMTPLMNADGSIKTDKNGRPVFARTGGAGKFIRYSERRKEVMASQDAEAERAAKKYKTKEIQDNEAFRTALAGGSLASDESKNRILARSLTEDDKADDEEVANAEIIMIAENLDGAQRLALAQTGRIIRYAEDADGKKYLDMNNPGEFNESMQKAAIDAVFTQGSAGDKEKLLAESGGKLEAHHTRIGKHSVKLASGDPSLGGKTLDDISTGKIKSEEDLQRARVRGVNEGRVDANSFSTMGATSLNLIRKSIDSEIKRANTSGDADAIKSANNAKDLFIKAAEGAMSNTRLSASFDGNDARKEVVEKLVYGVDANDNSLGAGKFSSIQKTAMQKASGKPNSNGPTEPTSPTTPRLDIPNQREPQESNGQASPQRLDINRGRSTPPPQVDQYTQKPGSTLYTPPSYKAPDNNNDQS